MRRRPSVSDEALGEWSESDIWRPAWSAAKRPESTQERRPRRTSRRVRAKSRRPKPFTEAVIGGAKIKIFAPAILGRKSGAFERRREAAIVAP